LKRFELVVAMKQKSGSVWECGGRVETSGANHSFREEILFHVRWQFQNGFTLIECSVVIKNRN
jgi:hypothetical protein